ncbi:hypothetical protein D9756_008613 [Leucocoprinus leucothites]|uniref:Uncharacterized protein n=1 Tax=Leucocoprinus leucothites TaxID=201217 RepID=A0A8H5CYM1_9AGAR|nr:hypothetical protein D9756_008613 [Leucoagaricus leucothites]
MSSPPISSSTSVNDDELALRKSIKKFLELKREDFVIGVIPSSEPARSAFIEALKPPGEGPWKIDEPEIETICIQRSPESTEGGRIVLAISPEFTQKFQADKVKIKNLRAWMKTSSIQRLASFGEDHAKTYAHFDALLYLHRADQPIVKSGFSLASYKEGFIQLLSGEKEMNPRGSSCSHNLRRLQLVLLTNSSTSATATAEPAESDPLLEKFKEPWSLFLRDGSSRRILPEDVSAFMATIADNEQESQIRELERAIQKAEESAPGWLQDSWSKAKRLLSSLTSAENPENLSQTIQGRFGGMAELAKKARWDAGQALITFITKKARRLLEVATRHVLIRYRKGLIGAASRGLVSMDKTKFYGEGADKKNGLEASGQEDMGIEDQSHN